MKTFLIVVAGVIVAVILILLIAFWVLKHKLKGFVEGLGEAIKGLAGGGIPPFRVTLEPESEPEWKNASGIQALTRELEGLGYRAAGDYSIEEMGITLRGFAHPEASVYAALYEHPQKEMVILDLFSAQADGTGITVSNAPETGLDEPPFRSMIRLELDGGEGGGGGALLFHEKLLEARGSGQAEPVAAGTFASSFQKAYAREMDWRIERGGVTPEEVRRVNALTANDGEQPEEADEAAVQHVIDLWTGAIEGHLDERLHEEYLKTSTLSAAEWEEKRERIFFVHERKRKEGLIQELAWIVADDLRPPDSGDGEEDDDDEEDEGGDRYEKAAREKLEPAFEGPSLREAFAAAQELLAEAKRFERIGTVAGEYPADVWLRPSWEGDDDGI